MNMVFVWIEKYNKFNKRYFNLSNNYVIKYDEYNNSFILSTLRNIPRNFFGENLNLKAIVGKNGTGKTSLIEAIIGIHEFKKNSQFDGSFIIFQQGEDFYYSGAIFKRITLVVDGVSKNLRQVNDTVNMLYYSPCYQPFSGMDKIDIESTADVSNNARLKLNWKKNLELEIKDQFKFFEKFPNLLNQESFEPRNFKFDIPIPTVNEFKRYIKNLLKNKPLALKNENLNFVERFKKKLNADLLNNNHDDISVEFLDLLLNGDINYEHNFEELTNKAYSQFKKNIKRNNEEPTYIYIYKRFFINMLFQITESINLKNQRLIDYEYLAGLIVMCITDHKSFGEYLDEASNDLLDSKSTKDMHKVYQKLHDFNIEAEDYSKDLYNVFKGDIPEHFTANDYKQCIKLYNKLIKNKKLFSMVTFEWTGISTGEIAKLNLFSRINSGIEYNLNSKSHLKILLDEPDIFFHPEWQRQLISDLIEKIPRITSNFLSVEIFLTTHSPLILSDLPEPCVLFLNDDLNLINHEEIKKTFASNIHELYWNGFFVTSTVGQFAQSKISDVIKTLKDNDIMDNDKKQEVKKIIDLIGDIHTKELLENKYYEKFGNVEEIEKKIIEQINFLNQRLAKVRSIV